jgi:ribosomal protein S18 acetylase RimI-like enzyme
MLVGANLVVSARMDLPDKSLVGFARCATDFACACYVADLAVSVSVHGQGAGQSLMEEVRRQVGTGVTVLLLSVPEAVGFYRRIGMKAVEDALWFRREF